MSYSQVIPRLAHKNYYELLLQLMLIPHMN